jgi:anti-sigma factor ChrR (cupin superfamily)
MDGQSTPVMRRSLNDILRLQMNDQGLAALSWRDFGNGLSMARLAREGKREVVLYRIAEHAAPDAFLQHEHPGGELYLVLRGQIADDSGIYEEGDFVWLGEHSVHTPRAIGETVVLVVWPDGVRVVE